MLLFLVLEMIKTLYAYLRASLTRIRVQLNFDKIIKQNEFLSDGSMIKLYIRINSVEKYSI